MLQAYTLSPWAILEDTPYYLKEEYLRSIRLLVSRMKIWVFLEVSVLHTIVSFYLTVRKLRIPNVKPMSFNSSTGWKFNNNNNKKPTVIIAALAYNMYNVYCNKHYHNATH